METTKLHRGRLFDYVQLVVRDLNASEKFCKAIMSVVNIPVFSTDNGYFMAEEFVISSADSATAMDELAGRHNLAFQARGRATVDAFYSAVETADIRARLAGARIIPPPRPSILV